MIESFIDAVRNRSVGEKRRKTSFTGVQQCFVSLHVQIRLLLSCKGSVWQVFRSRAASHGNIRKFVSCAPAQFAVRRENLTFQVLRKFCCENRVSNLAPSKSQLLYISCVQTLKELPNSAG